MKKITALLLSLALCLVSTGVLCEAAQSEEVESIELGVTYESTEFVIDEAASGVLVPANWTVTKFSEEDAAHGLIYSSVNPKNNVNLQIHCVHYTGQTLEDAVAALEATEGIYDIDFGKINGILYVMYSTEEPYAGTLLTDLGNGIFVSFTFIAKSEKAGEALGTLPFELAGSLYAIAQ